VIDETFGALVPMVGVSPACELTGVSRATHYRKMKPPVYGPPKPRPTPPNALSDAERSRILTELRRPEHADLAVAQVWARLLDEDVYLASQSTMYRLLREHGESGERRRQARHPAKTKPQLQASGPNQCWSWDITKLRGPQRGVYYDLYVIIDIFSRHVVAWTIAEAEDGKLAADLIEAALIEHGIHKGQLSLHADRGGAMISKPVSQLLIDLGVARTHSRPHVSNDNPYSESHFKTLKYCPAFPGHFGSIQDARAFCTTFFAYYNHEHRHSALGLHTPASVHYGDAIQIRKQRQQTLDTAYAANPDRFNNRPPTAPKLPTVAWINPPTPEPLIQSA
jgi:putative transposase